MVLVALQFSGCATIMSGTDHKLSIDTNVNGAKCKLTNSEGVSWYVKETPGFVLIKKGDSPLTIDCKKNGYDDSITQVDGYLNGVTLLNILLGGVIGFGLDIVTGAITSYPDKVEINLDQSDDIEHQTHEVETPGPEIPIT